ARVNQRSMSYMLARTGVYALALAITLFMLVPVYLIAISAFSPQDAIFAYPKSIIPTSLSADTMLFFLNARGVTQGLLNSVIVGLLTLVLSRLFAPPAGSALARSFFRGATSFHLSF